MAAFLIVGYIIVFLQTLIVIVVKNLAIL